jgi:hypothetical protein
MFRHGIIRKSGSELAPAAGTAELATSGKHVAGRRQCEDPAGLPAELLRWPVGPSYLHGETVTLRCR